ncbi:U-reduvitoxin-Pr21-like [Bolinopsis microptera]|uniref:U-reduvitoxin-Pr21-like n=1 Tax=Bolinopsis microptera TaxID=2820187 RepID=UPI003078A9CD
MLLFVLLGAVLMSASLVVGRDPGGIMCQYEDRFLTVGKKIYSGCEVCQCKRSGKIKCSEEPACCPYLDKKGRTKLASPGDSYTDGCNQCTCGAEGGMGACTKMGCPNKCAYKNWDMVSGYAKKGKVHAYDEERDCPVKCKCKVKKGQATLKCKPDCY